MSALDRLHRQLPHRVLRGWEMPLIDTCLVRVITRDAKSRTEKRQKRRVGGGYSSKRMS